MKYFIILFLLAGCSHFHSVENKTPRTPSSTSVDFVNIDKQLFETVNKTKVAGKKFWLNCDQEDHVGFYIDHLKNIGMTVTIDIEGELIGEAGLESIKKTENQITELIFGNITNKFQDFKIVQKNESVSVYWNGRENSRCFILEY